MSNDLHLRTYDSGAYFSVGQVHKVPTLPKEIHHDTNFPYASSPETLDEAINDDFQKASEPGSPKGIRDDIRPLKGDYGTPFSISTDPSFDAADDIDVGTDRNQLDSTHPKTDAAGDMDPTQLYNEGESGAAEASEPNAGSSVVGFRPVGSKTFLERF